MRVSFVRTGERHDHVHVERDDGTTLDWAWPAGGLPHDLVHLVAERHLGMRDAIWGQVAAGADLPAKPTPAGAVKAAHHADTPQARAVLASEAIAAAVTRGVLVPELTPVECLELTIGAVDADWLPPACTSQALGAIVDEVRRLARRWQDLPPRAALVLDYEV
jgi:hypothetical protein